VSNAVGPINLFSLLGKARTALALRNIDLTFLRRRSRGSGGFCTLALCLWTRCVHSSRDGCLKGLSLGVSYRNKQSFFVCELSLKDLNLCQDTFILLFPLKALFRDTVETPDILGVVGSPN
jgi:hypothetical protein